MSQSLDDVMSGKSWEQFCDLIKAAGVQILRPETPSDALNRAEGLRYLSRLGRLGLEMYVESGDMEFPTFMIPSHETAKIGADNPDNLYQMARIDGRLEYRVTGTRGSVAYLNFSTKRGGYDSKGNLELSGFIDAKTMVFDDEGRFELVLSQTPREGNWLKVDSDTVQLLIRQTFLDRQSEVPSQIKIQRLDSSAKPKPLDAEVLHQNLLKAGHFVGGTARLFADWANGYRGHSNELPPANQAVCQAAGGDPNVFFYHSHWKLADDEALVIEFPRVADADYWNFQVDNYWMESLDYRHFRISLNKHSGYVEQDGRLVIIVSAQDAGHPNWLETAGHHEGTMCFRWINSREQVHPTTRVIKLPRKS